MLQLEWEQKKEGVVLVCAIIPLLIWLVCNEVAAEPYPGINDTDVNCVGRSGGAFGPLLRSNTGWVQVTGPELV